MDALKVYMYLASLLQSFLMLIQFWCTLDIVLRGSVMQVERLAEK